MSDSIEGTRHTIRMTFGYGHTDWNVDEFFMRHLTKMVSNSFGGFRYNVGTGFWRSDGNDEEPPYNGELFEEDSVTLVVTVDEDPDFAISILEECCTFAKMRTVGNVPMEWVNVEVTESRSHHFKM